MTERRSKKFNTNFTIIIDDQYCKWEFPLDIPSTYSIDMVAKAIFKAFELEAKEGQRVLSK